MGEAAAVRSGDMALGRAAGASSARELEAMAEAWRPFRATAATHLWHGASTFGKPQFAIAN
jgi:3-methyladenine DNA glycosylase/8-oxoguanine DNA glycosylase